MSQSHLIVMESLSIVVPFDKIVEDESQKQKLHSIFENIFQQFSKVNAEMDSYLDSYWNDYGKLLLNISNFPSQFHDNELKNAFKDYLTQVTPGEKLSAIETLNCACKVLKPEKWLVDINFQMTNKKGIFDLSDLHSNDINELPKHTLIHSIGALATIGKDSEKFFQLMKTLICEVISIYRLTVICKNFNELPTSKY